MLSNDLGHPLVDSDSDRENGADDRIAKLKLQFVWSRCAIGSLVSLCVGIVLAIIAGGMYLYNLRNMCDPIDVVPTNGWSWNSNAKLCDGIWFGTNCIIDCKPLEEKYKKNHDGLKTLAVCKYDEGAGAYFWAEQTDSLSV
eukprot:35484_1